ncbi:NgoPII family restriction endonuclease, partial [Testudinibacter aquarius]
MEKNMANIINAIINLVREPQFRLREYATGRNRANNMGESLEEYIKDLFADTVN